MATDYNKLLKQAVANTLEKAVGYHGGKGEHCQLSVCSPMAHAGEEAAHHEARDPYSPTSSVSYYSPQARHRHATVIAPTVMSNHPTDPHGHPETDPETLKRGVKEWKIGWREGKKQIAEGRPSSDETYLHAARLEVS